MSGVLFISILCSRNVYLNTYGERRPQKEVSIHNRFANTAKVLIGRMTEVGLEPVSSFL